ncbi:HNH endonuclease [Paenibacillus sp. N10]|uniref:HNH endonuclease n=1 Tax=Paenibacillus lutrae TaxID=2078573 RepID=A0A7X3FIU6_9BACL|nr:HNH endonuclease [Paenibacillus lutrae]
MDLKDQQFGDLTVIRSVTIGRRTLWLCRCSCKKEIPVSSSNLTRGVYTSCGCKRVQKRDAGVKKHIADDRINGTRKSALRAKLHSENKSGVKGVIWIEARQRWKAYIGFKGKSKTLGYRTLKEDAIALRKAAEEKYHKPYLENEDSE